MPDCSQSTRSRTPLCKVPAQPRTSTRPQLQASCFCSEKALPGACRRASTEKGLHAPYHLPSCPSVQPTLQEQGGPVQTLRVPAGSELLLSTGRGQGRTRMAWDSKGRSTGWDPGPKSGAWKQGGGHLGSGRRQRAEWGTRELLLLKC